MTLVPKNMPSAEIPITLELVHQLLMDQHPDLAHLPMTVVAEGWDNLIVRLGSDLLGRFPRRHVAVDLILKEQTWLPLLEGRLPLPIPTPTHIGSVSKRFPYPWSITSYFPGHIASQAAPLDETVVAQQLGAFLGALHHQAPNSAPPSEFGRGTPLSERAWRDDGYLATLRGHVDTTNLEAVLQRGRDAATWQGPPLWIHGDLHPANLIADKGTLGAVIDFGDLTAGDPATDLAGLWMLLPESQHHVFWNAYEASAPFG
ncbi:MAG: aminoglycoside phosphotransferase family protein, partial [Actinomycetota bacterium]